MILKAKNNQNTSKLNAMFKLTNKNNNNNSANNNNVQTESIKVIAATRVNIPIAM